MTLKLNFVLLILYVVVIDTYDLNQLKRNVLHLLDSDYVKEFRDNFVKVDVKDDLKKESKGSESQMKQVKSQNEGNEIVNRAHEDSTSVSKEQAELKKKESIVAPIIDNLDLRDFKDPGLKKLEKSGHFIFNPEHDKQSSSKSLSSSSRELADWKSEWEDLWHKKKFEALNATKPKGDVVNIAAARPWGTPCGDPNQHDMPWGTCMLDMECEAEHRIYRGDFACGRTGFVCCGFQLSTYDMDQANDDISLEDKSLSQDSAERKIDKQKDAEAKKRRKERHKKKRRQRQIRRKRKIRRRIKYIIKEMFRLMRKMFRNQTRVQHKKTKELKKFVKRLKKQYKKDRLSMLDIHNEEMIKIDQALLLKLHQIKNMNQNFVNNATFRDILVNGTVSKNTARMLVEAYPEMYTYLPAKLKTKDMLRSKSETRRSANGIGRRRMTETGLEYPYKDYLEYDIEYGYLYY